MQKLFNVALKLTTAKMDLLVAKWRAKNKSYVSQKRNHAKPCKKNAQLHI